MSPHEHRPSVVNDVGEVGEVNGHNNTTTMNGEAPLHEGNGLANNDMNNIDNSPQQQLHVKDEEWDNLGRSFLQCNDDHHNNNNNSHEESIERNSAMLEDLLLLALQHDASTNNTPKLTQLPSQLKSQLQSYVTQISLQYHRVGFHSFEHASHVMLSATKLCYMLKDAAPSTAAVEDTTNNGAVNPLYDSPTTTTTTKITTNSIYDPWLHFALTFAALLHDVDHKGLPNAVLKSHSDPLSIRYGSPICMSSYAEWNSVDIGLSLLECEEFDLLRGVLLSQPSCGSESSGGGQQRVVGGGRENFMKLVQDLVLCTDIASAQRRELGMSKWDRLFVSPPSKEFRRRSSCDTLEVSNTKSAKAKIANDTKGEENNDDDGVQGEGNTTTTNNESSITQKKKKIELQTPEAARAIAEQIMQAADVSHTMQHFETFLKWNQSLYHEILAAHHQAQKEEGEGSSEEHEKKNDRPHPAQNWYESQIGFYDFYVIPLAKRLDACGAFGMGGGSGGGYFGPLAVRNKELWILRGRECTRIMVNEAEGIELPPPMPLNVADEGEDEEDEEEENGGVRPMPKSSFLQRRILGSQSFDEESSGEDDEEVDENDVANDKTDASSLPGSVETSGRVSFVSMASSRASTSSKSLKWGPKSGEEEIDSSVNALVPNMLVKQLVDSLENECDLAPREQQMSALREAVSKYQSNGSIRRHRGALLFVDISGFTNLAQNYPVEDFKTFINRYFTKIINLIKSFGGEVVKFAGDALYAIWTCQTIEKSSAAMESHAINIEKCTACAIAISSECNGYKISKSYNRRASSAQSEASSVSNRAQGEVLYNFQDKSAEYEERGAILNVYCGVSEGIMAGVDVVSSSRAEFFLIGKPLKDVAQAEHLAGPGEAVVSPSVHKSLASRRAASDLAFTVLEDGFQRVLWPDHPPVSEMVSYYRDLEGKNSATNEKAQLQIDRLVRSHWRLESLEFSDLDSSVRSDLDLSHRSGNDVDSIGSDGSSALGSLKPDCLQSDIMQLLEYHRHEATRDVRGKFTAELRRVIVIFISIMFEPNLPNDPSEDSGILENFQNIYTIITESVVSRSGQVRQFINDDKGTVFIASFGLRGSVTLHPSSTAVEAAKEAQEKLLRIMDIQSSIGITLGKVFCGETGSPQRYEYSLLGPSCNLSARLMAKGAPGEINCDEEVKKSAGGRQEFTFRGSHKLKGYEMPVPFYMPIEGKYNGDEENDDITTFFLQNEEVLKVANNICEHPGVAESDTSQPRLLLIKGNEEKGQQPFISAILNQPLIRSSSVIMEANRCFHDDPFYCFIPIVTRILLSSTQVRERIQRLHQRYKRSSVLGSLISNDALRAPAHPSGTKLVPDGLAPFLPVINDFLYKGFPLMKSTAEAKKLKDKEKIDKCVEVLSALITNFFRLGEKRGIISIPMFDSIDEYSKKLLRHIFASDSTLLIVGGVDDSSPLENDEAKDGVEAFLRPFIGDSAVRQVEVVLLNILDKQSSLDLFSLVLRRDFPEEVKGLNEDSEVQDKIMEHCEGMVNVTAELAHTFCTQLRKERENYGQNFHLPSYLTEFLGSTPTSSEELIAFRFDKMSAEEQMLLKIASVAGFDQFSFSQNLLETVLLALSRADHEQTVDMSTIDEDSDELLEGGIPKSIGGDVGVPMNIGAPNSVNNYEYMFQGSFFEQTLESLVEQKFLVEINVEMSDLASMDSVMYRFRSTHEQSVINGLMLNDQKQRTHFEVALHYQSTHSRESGTENPSDSDDVSGSLSTDITIIPTTNWQLFHVTALHYDLADAHLPALLQYYESSTQLAWLGMRDGAHGRLLSAYLMLEKMLRDATALDIYVNETTEQRQTVASQMVKIIGNKELSDVLKGITKEHLRSVFDGDILAFKTTLSMLTKFGQSVGTIEKEGYKFGSELYLQAILLVLLVLDDDAFSNLTSNLDSFLKETNIQEMKHREIPEVDNSKEFDSDTLGSDDLFSSEDFDMDDLAISFPAFSGLLTFYRDSPIGANQVQETFLANLFVAVTQEANEMIHVLRTKCILSHLYLKHGDIEKALEECEGIMDIYDHDAYSLQLVNTYGMDWSLICVGTMASTYLFRGQFTAAQRSVDFLTKQMQVIDEFASSTKVMSRGTVSSYYLRLFDLSRAHDISSGIATTQYGYFFKEHGTLQERLAEKELALQNSEAFADSDGGFDLLSILSSDNIYEVQQKRSMLRQSAETLCDRGVEAIQAAICQAEVRNLESSPASAEVVGKQLQFCQAGLIYLNQTLSQNDANNHERRKNYLLCLHQKAHLLFWHQKILQRLRDDFVDASVNDLLELEGREMDQLRQCWVECDELSKKYDYVYMQLLVGKSFINLKIDETVGEELITSALEKLTPSDRTVAEELLTRIDT
eukprot:scaffold11014_cov110-Skeletonema_dohrnii-CCMP3373.AAC.1